MNTLQSNVDYLTTKIENNIDKTDNDDNFKYEQDTNQGKKKYYIYQQFEH